MQKVEKFKHLQIELRCEIRLILKQTGKLEEGKFSSEVISGEVEAIRLQLWSQWIKVQKLRQMVLQQVMVAKLFSGVMSQTRNQKRL